MSLDLLPTEIISRIVCNLSMVRDRLHLNAVNRTFRKRTFEWPDVDQLTVGLIDFSVQPTANSNKLHIDNPTMLQQFGRFPRLKKMALCLVDPSDLDDRWPSIEEVMWFLGRTVEELEIHDATSSVLIKRYVIGFIHMPRLRKLELSFYSNPHNLLLLMEPKIAIALRQNSSIERLRLSIPDDENLLQFVNSAAPENLQVFSLTMQKSIDEMHFVKALPKTLVKLEINLAEDSETTWPHLYTVDYSHLTSLEMLSIICCWPWTTSLGEFMQLLQVFVKSYLSTTIGLLRIAQHRQFDYLDPIEQLTGPFAVAREQFEQCAAEIGWDREKALTIEMVHSFESAPVECIQVHEKLRFVMITM